MKFDLEKLLTSKVDLVSSNALSKYVKPNFHAVCGVTTREQLLKTKLY
jgi:predicted nucleotidyltransferase